MVAFWCWLEGRFNKPDEFWRGMPEDEHEGIGGYRVKRKTIPDYNTSEFREWITAWNFWEGKNLLPFAGSWTEQPAQVIDVFSAFDNAYAKFVKREAARRKAEQSARNMRGRR